MATGEDRWDRLLREQHCVGQGQDIIPAWTEAYVNCISLTKAAGEISRARDRKLASRMQQIIDMERELAEKEKKGRKRAKRMPPNEEEGEIRIELNEEQSIDYVPETEKTHEADAPLLEAAAGSNIRTVPSSKRRVVRRVRRP